MSGVFKISIIYLSSMALVLSQAMPAYAGLIGTEQSMAQQLVDQDRDILRNMIKRDEAQKLLENYGVTYEQAQERINAMTNEEVRIFAQQLEELPAAGGVGIAAALLILILLFIALELSGKTDVFNGI